MKNKVCIIGNLFETYSRFTQGGMESQLMMLAISLLDLGSEVFIIDYTVRRKFKTKEGFTFYPISKRNNKTLADRITKRVINVYNLVINLKCDYYVSSMIGIEQLAVLLASRRIKAKYFYWVAADLELTGFWKRYYYWYRNNITINKIYSIFLSEIFFPKILKEADIIFVQHKDQLKISSRKEDIYLLNNVFEHKEIKSKKDNFFVWVGSLDFTKGFNQLEDLAKALSDIKIKIIGRVRDKKCVPILDRMKRFNNVEYLGHLESNEDVITLMSKSNALINTAKKEGFPITFIEAWSQNIPVISLYVDPGNVITDNQLGFCANGNIRSFVKCIKSYKRNNYNNNIRHFYEENYSYKYFIRNIKQYFIF